MLASKYGMTLEQARDAQRQMEQRAAAYGLTFRMADLRSGNTRDAHRLLHLAKAQGKQAELAERLHRAYFTDQASIFDHSSLADLAASTGLDRDKALGVLASDDYDAGRRRLTRRPPGRSVSMAFLSSSSTGATGSPARSRPRS